MNSNDKNASFGALYALDSLNRLLPDSNQVGKTRENRVVGCFYFLTHGASGQKEKNPVNITRLMGERPEAFHDAADPAWNQGPLYWDEPLFGFYTVGDKWVLRRHVKLLTCAGVDFLIFDTTNRVTFWNGVRPLLEVLDEYRKEGWNVPKIAYYTNTLSGETVNEIWNDL